MVHARQSRPDSGLGSQAKALETFCEVVFSLGSGCYRTRVSGTSTVVPRSSKNTPPAGQGLIARIERLPVTELLNLVDRLDAEQEAASAQVQCVCV